MPSPEGLAASCRADAELGSNDDAGCSARKAMKERSRAHLGVASATRPPLCCSCSCALPTAPDACACLGRWDNSCAISFKQLLQQPLPYSLVMRHFHLLMSWLSLHMLGTRCNCHASHWQRV